MSKILGLLTPWLAASALFFALPAFADVPSYALIKEKSFLKFYAIQNGAPVEGSFNDFTADIHFDPAHLDQSSITVEVNTGSVTMADADILKTLKMSEWLSTAAFPKAVFTCKKLTRMPQSDNYYADGMLKLRDKEVPVILNFQMVHFDDTTAIATGYVSLKRLDFGVGQGEWAKDDVIKNEVRVEFRFAAQKK